MPKNSSEFDRLNKKVDQLVNEVVPGYQNYEATSSTIDGIETMHLI